MTMPTAAYKQGTILERLRTALRLRRSIREANNLTKIVTLSKVCFFKKVTPDPSFFVKNYVSSGYYPKPWFLRK